MDLICQSKKRKGALFTINMNIQHIQFKTLHSQLTNDLKKKGKLNNGVNEL